MNITPGLVIKLFNIGILNMRSKNSLPLSKSERTHIENVKLLPCSVCGASGPSDAHHIKQGQHFTVVALCKDCHQGSENGWHGRKTMWRIYKMDELDALAITIEGLFNDK